MSHLTTKTITDMIGARASEFIDQHQDLLDEISPDTHVLIQAVREFLLGGKRMRGVLLFRGWQAAGGDVEDLLIDACAAMEFLQAAALMHDDVIDRSDTRRGGPSIHHRFSQEHRFRHWRGSSEEFGVAAAILLGDLCLSWADSLLFRRATDHANLREAKLHYDLMRTELMAGQFLDTLVQAQARDDVDAALQVATFKSGKYSVERPLQLGALLAGASDPLVRQLGEYGTPLGVAFQLRDDLLGIFGDPAVTGKPAGDDLREGKRTVPIALAMQRTTPQQAALLEHSLGRSDLTGEEIGSIQEMITASGAASETEAMIGDYAHRATAALDGAGLPQEAESALTALAGALTQRSA